MEESLDEGFDLSSRASFRRAAVSLLPPASAQRFEELAGHWGGDHVEDIMCTKSFEVDL